MIGGAEVMLEKLLVRMNRDHFRNVVVSLTDRGVLGTPIEKLGISLYCLGMRRGRPGLGGILKLLALLRREQPSILQD